MTCNHVAIAIGIALFASSCAANGGEVVGHEPASRASSAEPTATPTLQTPSAPKPAPTLTPVPPSPTAQPTPPARVTPAPTVFVTPEPSPQDRLAAALAVSTLETSECPPGLGSESIRCHVAVLPLHFGAPSDGEFVEVAVAYVDNGDPLGIGPVVYFQGGPGISSLPVAPRLVGADFDAIFFDQRGSGESRPKLDCPEVDELWPRQHTDDELLRIDDEPVFDAYEACAARLRADGVDFDAFHTDAVAADAELLRVLLGVDEWSIWGVSYGTRVAMTVMRSHPGAVRAAVLDSVVPFEVDFFASLPENANRAFVALDASCDATSCGLDHGDFELALVELVRAMEDEPVVVSTNRAVTGEPLPYRVTGSEVLEFVFVQMYSTRALSALPRQVSRARFGGLEELVAAYVSRRDPERLDLAAALYYTTWCREEVPFHDPTHDDVALADLTTRYGPAYEIALSVSQIMRVCGYFGVEPAPAIHDQPLASDIPTLVFAGAFDPITPPEWSRSVADSLANATYVEMADHGHGMTTRCPAQVQVDFLVRPDDDPDSSCAAVSAGPDFD